MRRQSVKLGERLGIIDTSANILQSGERLGQKEVRIAGEETKGGFLIRWKKATEWSGVSLVCTFWVWYPASQNKNKKK